MLSRISVALLVFLCLSCQKRGAGTEGPSEAIQSGGVTVTHASRFQITYGNGYKVLTVDRPWQGSERPLKYYLKQKGEEGALPVEDADVVIDIPVTKLICTSTTHTAFLESLEVGQTLVGFPQTQFLYSPALRSRLGEGYIEEVGVESDLNIEKILAIDPDFVMGFSSGSESGQLAKLRELGVPVVMNADYLETSVLGRAEWIKFVGAFVNKEVEAEMIFEEVASRYDSLLRVVQGVDSPKVYSGLMYGGSWYMSGGNNHVAKLIEDAGGEYLWADSNESGWLNLDFEVVYARAVNADIWIGAADFVSLASLQDADPRYADFDAFKRGNVYAYVGKIGETGANDYFESAIIRPDILLADHIKMIHPELMPDYELYYYRKLQ